MRRSAFALASVVTIFAITIALVWGIAASGNLTSESSQLVNMIVGIVATSVPAILALARIEDVRHDIHNDVLKNKVKEAIKEDKDENGGA